MLSLEQPLKKVIARSADLKKSVEADTKYAVKQMKQVADVEVIDKKQRAMLQELKKLANSMQNTVLDKNGQSQQFKEEDQQQEKEAVFLQDVIRKQVQQELKEEQVQQTQQVTKKDKSQDPLEKEKYSFDNKPVSIKSTTKQPSNIKDYPALSLEKQTNQKEKQAQADLPLTQAKPKQKKLNDVINAVQQEHSLEAQAKGINSILNKRLKKMTQTEKEKVSQILQRQKEYKAPKKTDFKKDVNEQQHFSPKKNKIAKLLDKTDVDFEAKSKVRLKKNIKENTLTQQASDGKTRILKDVSKKQVDTTKLKSVTYTIKSKEIVKLSRVTSGETEKEWQDSALKKPGKEKTLTPMKNTHVAEAEDKEFPAVFNKTQHQKPPIEFKDSLMSARNQADDVTQQVAQQASQTPAPVPEALQTAVQWMADDDVENRLVDLLSRQARLRGVDLS